MAKSAPFIFFHGNSTLFIEVPALMFGKVQLSCPIKEINVTGAVKHSDLYISLSKIDNIMDPLRYSALAWLSLCIPLFALLFPVEGVIRARSSRSFVEMSSKESSYTVGDLRKLTTKTSLASVCGPQELLSAEARYPENTVSVMKEVPTVNRFVVANPKAMSENPEIAKSVGLDFDTLDPSMPLEMLAEMLPVIYVADLHPEYGTMGFMLNKKSDKTMNDVSPEFRSFRPSSVYLGGAQNRGNSFTMLHRRHGFPENRALKVLPSEEGEFKLYFSPDVAMANELCSTGDATPAEFKFFQWSTVWLPKQLDLEYERKCWLTLKAPADIIFEEHKPSQGPLWRRLVGS